MNIHLPFWCILGPGFDCPKLHVHHVLSLFHVFCGALLQFHSAIWWWTTEFGLISFGPNPCGWLETNFAHRVSVCPRYPVFQIHWAQTIRVNKKLFALVFLMGICVFVLNFVGLDDDEFSRGLPQFECQGGTVGVPTMWKINGLLQTWLVGTLVKRAWKKATGCSMFISSHPQYRQPTPKITLLVNSAHVAFLPHF